MPQHCATTGWFDCTRECMPCQSRHQRRFATTSIRLRSQHRHSRYTSLPRGCNVDPHAAEERRPSLLHQCSHTVLDMFIRNAMNTRVQYSLGDSVCGHTHTHTHTHTSENTSLIQAYFQRRLVGVGYGVCVYLCVCVFVPPCVCVFVCVCVCVITHPCTYH